VSSSAAIEVAIAHGIVGSFKLTADKRTIALLCQKAENLIVGAACGVMDHVWNKNTNC
jgi:galactokinase